MLTCCSPRCLRIRHLAPGEDGPLRRVFAGLSRRSRYLRYQRAAPLLATSTVTALVRLQPGTHEALVAEVDDEPVGIARWIRSHADAQLAEIAVEVVDAEQGRGIGGLLAGAAARGARDAGVDYLTFWVHAEHGRLRQRLLRLGATPVADEPGQFRLSPRALLTADRGFAAPDSVDGIVIR
jgi:GNAT superfamily N-acetyltransferase